MAEHSPTGKRGYYTSFIQTTATLGLFLSLLVILFTRTILGEAGLRGMGLAHSVPGLGRSARRVGHHPLRLNESPVFQKMKDEGKGSKAPLTEAFANWSNAKIVLIALFGGVMGQGVVWYTGQFYALFFMQSILKVDGYTANLLIAWSLLLGTGFFIVFGALSDKIGRKPIILGRLPDRGADLLPDLPDDHHQRQPGAGKGHRDPACSNSATHPEQHRQPAHRWPTRRLVPVKVGNACADRRFAARSKAQGGRDAGAPPPPSCRPADATRPSTRRPATAVRFSALHIVASPAAIPAGLYHRQCGRLFRDHRRTSSR